MLRKWARATAFYTTAVFTESWLDSSVPDSAVSIEGYSVTRRDRCRNGGGIIAFIQQAYKFRVLTAQDIPSLESCESEILALEFSNTPLLFICVYHPFWSNSLRNDECIACVTDVIDHTVVTSVFDPSKLRVVVCGDFNGLHYHEISYLTQLKPIVTSPTRGTNVLDQIFVNFRQDCVPSVVSPLGRSDHAIVIWNVTPRQTKGDTRKVVTRKFSPSRKNVFCECVSNFDWQKLLQSVDDLDSSAALFRDFIIFL